MLLSSPSFSAHAGASAADRPWPPLLRFIAAVVLGVLLSLFLSSATLAQARRAAPAKKTTSSGGGSGAGYRTGIGLRAGGPSGLTIKHFFKGPVAVEGIVGTNYNRRGLSLTVLIEKHGPAFQSRGLQWYYGLGGHVSSYEGAYYYNWYYDKKGRARRSDDEYYGGRFWGMGIDGILGLEYLFTDLPFTLGVDAKPFAELTRGNAYFGLEGALSLRYAF